MTKILRFDHFDHLCFGPLKLFVICDFELVISAAGKLTPPARRE
jgi:hypothetical protein